MDGPTLSLALDPAAVPGMLDARDEFLAEASHPETIRAVVQSGLSTVDFFARVVRPERDLRGAGGRFFFRLLPGGFAAGGGAYITHENGHIHPLLHPLPGYTRTEFEQHLGQLIAIIGGINATQRAAEEILLDSPGDLSAHLAYLVFKLDLPVYVAVQSPLIRALKGHPGDVSLFLEWRRMNNGTNETGSAIGLALWETLGLLLPWQGSLRRVLDYLDQGGREATSRPFQRFSLSTTGYLSPVGTLFGARLTTYLDRCEHRPQAFVAEAWGSPSRQGEEGIPFGALLGVRHLPLMGGDKLRLEVGADYTFSYESADWGNEPGMHVWEPVVQAGVLSLHLAGDWGEVSLRGRCKETGFLPNELYQGGCEVLFGFQLETGAIF